MLFHFPQVFRLISESVWHNEKHPGFWRREFEKGTAFGGGSGAGDIFSHKFSKIDEALGNGISSILRLSQHVIIFMSYLLVSRGFDLIPQAPLDLPQH